MNLSPGPWGQGVPFSHQKWSSRQWQWELSWTESGAGLRKHSLGGFHACVIPDGNSDSLIFTRRQKDPIWRPSLMVSAGSETPCKSHEPVWAKTCHCWPWYSAHFVWQKVGQLPPWFAVGQKDPRHRMLQHLEITHWELHCRKDGDAWSDCWAITRDWYLTTSKWQNVFYWWLWPKIPFECCPVSTERIMWHQGKTKGTLWYTVRKGKVDLIILSWQTLNGSLKNQLTF